MKTKTNICKLLFFSLLGFTTISCQNDDLPLPQRTFFGPEVALGNGTVKSFVTLEAGAPQEIGLIFPEAALDNLPHMMANLTIELPQQVERTPFDHIGFDWNPHGHEPEGIYDSPHFDMHFYMITPAERMQIGLNDPLSEKLPEEKYMPSNYVPLPGSVPQMGKHWADPTSPELTGEGDFTQVMLFGSYNEEVTFYEPMITVEYLKEEKSEIIDLSLPEDYQQEGKYYPTKYKISFNQNKKEYTISLLGMVKR